MARLCERIERHALLRVLREQHIGGTVFAVSFCRTERGHRVNRAKSRIDDDECGRSQDKNDQGNGEKLGKRSRIELPAWFAGWMSFCLRLIASKHLHQRLLRLILIIHSKSDLLFTSSQDGDTCCPRTSATAGGVCGSRSQSDSASSPSPSSS